MSNPNNNSNLDNMAGMMYSMLKNQFGMSNIRIQNFIYYALNHDTDSFNPSIIKDFVFTNIEDAENERLINQLSSFGLPRSMLKIFLPRMYDYTLESEGDFLNALRLKHGISISELARQTYINKGFISDMIHDKRPIPKHEIFVFSLYFHLTDNQVLEFLEIKGKSFDDSIVDMTFQMFLKIGKYDIDDYIATCRAIADKKGVMLPDYFYG